MTSISPLNNVHELGSFGNFEGKNSNEIITIKELKNFKIIQVVKYKTSKTNIKEYKIFDLNFPSPLIGASFKSEKAIMSMWMRMGLGGTIYKTIMAKKRYGNPVPRLQDAIYDGRKGILNALGLPGPGIDTFTK